MQELRLVLCTFPDATTARQIGTSLIEMQLAACVNLIPGLESIYRWQGRIETSSEVLALFKTRAACLAAFESELTAAHPYEVPEIVVIDPVSVAGPYLVWVLENVPAPAEVGVTPQ
jgi:periplasmic divalent cation tolerance protein